MRTCELEGRLLDFWCAKAEGLQPYINSADSAIWHEEVVIDVGGSIALYSPTAFVTQAYSIVFRNRIGLLPSRDLPVWLAAGINALGRTVTEQHADPLVAAMRVFVRMQLGDTVQDMVEIKGGTA